MTRRTLAAALGLALFATSAAHAAAPAQPKEKPKVVHAGFVPDFRLKASLYHQGAGGVGGKDSLGCTPAPMRTVAIDPKKIPRRTVLFIAETVGLPLPGGAKHDGYWYASDVGGAVKGDRIDLYTGKGKDSMKPLMKLNLKKLSVARKGTFKGCPPKA